MAAHRNKTWRRRCVRNRQAVDVVETCRDDERCYHGGRGCPGFSAGYALVSIAFACTGEDLRCIHVVTLRGLGRSSMPATIMSDHAKAKLQKERRLGIPMVRSERPPVVEHDGLTVAQSL
jgi:hypothetical protein